jgi:hypothetical protein
MEVIIQANKALFLIDEFVTSDEKRKVIKKKLTKQRYGSVYLKLE